MLFLYRVLELDCHGDPLDHGVVEAVDIQRAHTLVSERLATIRGVTGEVRFYLLAPGVDAVLECNGYSDMMVQNPQEVP
jgi:hypothetical protein